MSRKVLCLVNSAAYSRNYFEELAPFLERQGYQVVFALDSHMSDVLSGLNRPIVGGWYFTDFAGEWVRNGKQPPLSPAHTWSSLFSDFDRFLTMDIRPPLSPDGPLSYADVPGLLEQFFTRIFDHERPVAVLYEQVSNAFAIAAYRQALRVGVPFCSLCPSRIAGRIEVSATGAFKDFLAVGEIYRGAAEGLISSDSFAIASEYIRTIDEQVPDYMKPQSLGGMIGQMSISRKYLRLEKIRHFLRSCEYRVRYAEDCALAFQHGDPVRLSIAFVKRAIRRRIRARFVAKYYEPSVPSREKYFLYPLHFHPEASTSVLASDFIDELSVIKAIAFRLPSDTKLYVKEHPSAIALQPIDFYRQLHEMPNVRLLAANLRAKELARKSLGVVCLTSTLGFEAAVLNRPVITFGDVLYGYFPNVRMISDYSALDESLNWAMTYEPVPSEQLLKATAAYVEFGAPGSFDFKASLGDKEALSSVAEAVAATIERGGGRRAVA